MKEPTPSDQQLATFRSLLSSGLGLFFDDDKRALLIEVLARRCKHHRWNRDEYLTMLAADPSNELRVLAQELTVGETYFFRHGEQMAAFAQEALPRRNAAREGRPLKILSAGCSTGEEPYSLVMLARLAGIPEVDANFLALDVNPVSLRKARGARYSAWSLRETHPEFGDRWFRKDGSEYVLDPAIARSVEFRECNLLAPAAEHWQTRLYDIIFCRNVLMYFTPQQARVVVGRLTESLANGGYLFLGHAETLRGLSEELELLNTHDCFYYQRPPIGALNLPSPSVPSPVELPLNWMETIQAASERINKMGQHQQESSASPCSAAVAPDLYHVRELQEKERYEEALEELLRLPAIVLEHPETLLLQAILRVHLSDYGQSEHLCRRLLEGANCAAGAHYVLALCREGHGDSEAATAEHRAATRLDPGFAMPRLHLGLLARRAKDLPTARKELEKAMLLLQGEDSSRLKLYGGGFGRDALVDLCRSELSSCRGPR